MISEGEYLTDPQDTVSSKIRTESRNCSGWKILKNKMITGLYSIPSFLTKQILSLLANQLKILFVFIDISSK